MTTGVEGKLHAIGGGGRYDELVSILGGRSIPAVGFAMGIERILLKLQEAKINFDKPKDYDVYVAQLGIEPRKKALKLFDDLRINGFRVTADMSKKGLKDQMDIANKRGVPYTLILGQKEISDETVLLRDMESGVQEVFDYKKIKTELKKRLANQEVKIIKTKK